MRHYGVNRITLCGGEGQGRDGITPVPGEVTCPQCRAVMRNQKPRVAVGTETVPGWSGVTLSTVAALSLRLRRDFAANYGDVHPIAMVAALTYELTSMIAACCTTPEAAVELIRTTAATMKDQVNKFGVGGPHP